jgi:hypothetical protein
MRAISLVSITVLAVSAVLSGCATAPPTRALLTYKTDPDGAQLFEGGKPLGMAPLTRTYDSDGKSNTIQTPDVKAVWPSGAETTFYTILPVGADRVATLTRPADAPKLQDDLDNAMKVVAARKLEAERLRALQKSDIARASDRCKQQQAGNSNAVSDDCM